MAKKDEFRGSGVFFTGKGVLRHGGVDYKSGQELPADVPAETLASLKAKGNASDDRPVKAAPAPGTSELQGKLTAAEDTIKAMEQAAQDGTARIAELEKNSVAREELIAELQGKLTAAQATIEQLTAQLTGGNTTPAPVPEAAEGGAGPKK